MAALLHGLRDWVSTAAGRLRQSLRPAPSFTQDYDRIFASLTRAELYGEEVPFETSVSASFLDRRRGSQRFMNQYSEDGGRLALERYGFFNLLRERGFDPQLSVNLRDPDEHRLQIHDGRAAPENLLIEVSMGFRDVRFPDHNTCHLLFINWLMMQNPRASFETGRPALPEQEHPGLGLFPHFGYLLRLMALRLRCDGLLNHPAHFHNAVLYGRFFKFLDPFVEGRFRALERDLAQLDLAQATRAVDAGHVMGGDGTPFAWEPAEQIAALTPKARGWFESRQYAARAKAARAACAFRYCPSADSDV